MAPGRPEKYRKIAEELARKLDEGCWDIGQMLPPERELGRQFGVTQLTIRRALKVLAESNRVHTVPSRGTFAGPQPKERLYKEIVTILIPDHELFYYRIFQLLEPILAAAGLHPVLHLTRGNAEHERELLSFFEEKGVAAVVAAPNAECAVDYAALTVPVVLFDVSLPGSGLPAVLSDDYTGALRMTEYLLGLGHRKIAHIAGNDSTAEARLAGFVKAHESFGIDIDESLIIRGNFSRDCGFNAANRLLELPENPTAIFCSNDTIAAGAWRSLKERGVNIPADISVTGFGNTEVSLDLGLTSVSQSESRMVDAIWTMLRDRLDGKKARDGKLMIDTVPVLRDSTAIPRNC